MAETYSSNLQLTLIGTGDLAGSWGGVVNNNIGSGLETAITGYYNVVYASADQQVYINNNQFSNIGGASSSDGRNMYFYCSGTNPSSQYLYVPANQKLYVVNNATSAGVIKVSNGSIGSPSGTAVTVPNGTIALVYNDGTNINLIASSSPAVASLTGPVTIAAGTGTSLTINGVAGTAALNVQTTGISIGTGLTDQGAGTLNVQNGIYLGGVNQFQNGSFTATYTGLVFSPTATCYYSIAGKSCTVWLSSTATASNSATFTITGLPTACYPARNQYFPVPDAAMYNNGLYVGVANGNGAYGQINTSGVFTFLYNNNPNGWSSTNVKGIGSGFAITYLLN